MIIEELQAIQDSIAALESAAENKELEASQMREEVAKLKDKAQLATNVLKACDEEKRELRNEMEAKLNSMYEDVLTQPDPGNFRDHIKEFAAAFNLALIEETEEAEPEEANAA